MELLGRLIREVGVDVATMEDGDRKKKYRTTLEKNLSALLDFKLMHSQAGEFVNTYLDPITLERLEALNDWLTGSGRFITLEQFRINAVIDELNALVGEIESSERTEIDEFLIGRLNELEVALENFSLFGGEGVADCLRRLAGEIGIARTVGGAASDALVQRTRRVGGFVIGALTALAFAYASVESIGWARGLLAGQPLFPAISHVDDRLLLPGADLPPSAPIAPDLAPMLKKPGGAAN